MKHGPIITNQRRRNSQNNRTRQNPKSLNKNNQLARLWPPFFFFWDRHGVLLADCMPEGTTINAVRYWVTLRKLWWAIQNKRRGRSTKGVRLHQDNVRPHVARKNNDTHRGIWMGGDYSPDIVPSDFHLFPVLKKRLDRAKIRERPRCSTSGYRLHKTGDKGIQKFVSRMREIIEREGDYTEK